MTNILFGVVRICRLRLKCNYLENEKFFLIVLFHFWILHQILNLLKKKFIVIATLFRKLQIVNDLVRPLSKKHPFRAPFHSQQVKGSQTLVKFAWEHFHHIFSSLWENQTRKLSPLGICYILAVFRNTLTANDKYPVRNGENFTFPIQMQLSLKPEIFSDCFVASLVSTSNFEHFEKKDDRHSYFISEITDYERLG